MSARGAHLVGSVPLESAEAVFRAAAEDLGGHLRRIPDGETGNRATWIVYQLDFLKESPDLEVEEPEPGQYAPLPRFRLRDPAAGAIEFPDGIGYAAVAVESYADFKRLKDEGVIGADVRFQVSLPTPLAPVAQFISHRDKAVIEPAYQRQMWREVEAMCAAIPPSELAIQWDVAIEMGFWENVGGLFAPWFEPVEDGIIDRLVECAAHTPEAIQMGFHFCYGDFGHEHFVEPADAGNLAAIAGRICAASPRGVDWIHMPVPRDRTDAAYFAPLAGLELPEGTELYLGLVHATDGAEGTRARIATASAAVSAFGVSTECGMGRRPPESVRPLLRVHADVLASA